MRPMELRDCILDQLAATNDLAVRTIDAADDAVRFEVKMTVTLSREAYDCLRERVESRGTRTTSELRAMIRRGLRDCLGADDDDERDAAAAERTADRIACRYGE